MVPCRCEIHFLLKQQQHRNQTSSHRHKDVDLICRQYCAMCLGNLACEPDNHAGLMAAGVVGACMTLMRTEDMESGR